MSWPDTDTETLANDLRPTSGHAVDCLNCGTPFSPGDRFCSHCAQKADTHRLTWRHFGHELLHAMMPADTGVLHLFRELILRPGVVAREYLAGKRKKYFSPFTWFLISAGTMVLIGELFGQEVVDLEADPGVLARLPNEAARASYLALVDRTEQLTHFMAKHGNVFAMAAAPIIALVVWLFYRRRYNYVEFLTAMLLFESVTNLLVPPVFQLLKWTNGGALYPHMGLGGQVVQVSYLAFALVGLLRLTSLRSRAGAVGVAAAAVFTWAVASYLALGWYLHQNWQFYRATFQMLRAL